ncbi:MAG TPA: glycosyltransferase family 9 protein, partial [bacterium]|nr:glycosyltransferase family 9 protein [bacterium]
ADTAPVLAPPAAELAAAVRARLGAAPYAVCHPGGGVRANWWPEERWRAILQRWTATGVTVAVIGGPEERDRVGRIADGISGARPLAGELTWPATAALLAGAAAFVGSDSGPLHLAAAYRRPLVALFGPDDPRRFAPHTPGAQYRYRGAVCSPCPQVGTRVAACTDNRCLTAITVDEVWSAVAALPAAPAR